MEYLRKVIPPLESLLYQKILSKTYLCNFLINSCLKQILTFKTLQSCFFCILLSTNNTNLSMRINFITFSQQPTKLFC